MFESSKSWRGHESSNNEIKKSLQAILQSDTFTLPPSHPPTTLSTH